MRRTMATMIALWLASAFGQEGDRTTLALLNELVQLRGKQYLELRKKVLERGDLEEAVRDFQAASQTLRGRVLAEALLFRKGNPEEAYLTDAGLSRLSWTRMVRPPERTLISDGHIRVPPYVLVISLGTDTAPVVCESLLLSSKCDPAMCCAILIKMHWSGSAEVLLEVLRSGIAIYRAAAVYNLGKLLAGLKAESIGPFVEDTLFADRLRALAKRRELPGLILDTVVRDRIETVLRDVLSKDSDPQVRALAAHAMGQFGSRSIGPLTAALGRDSSPWVRAWCALSVKAIGSEQGEKALAGAKETEKDPEVLLVLHGKSQPIEPWLNIPFDSMFGSGAP